ARTGIYSGEGYRWNINVGGAQGKLYYQLGLSQLRQETFPLSKDFTPVEYQIITTERMHSAMMSKRVLKSDIHLLKIRNTHWDMCCKTDRRAILHIWVIVHDFGIGRPGINRACTSSVTPDWANSAA